VRRLRGEQWRALSVVTAPFPRPHFPLAANQRATLLLARDWGRGIFFISETMAKKQKLFTTSQPEEWQAAFRAEAKRRKKPLSEWVGDLLLAGLPAKVRANLPKRPPANRPKKDQG